MEPNPALRRLGFEDDDRVVILHADDVGMCQATLAAYADLLDFGLLSSAATMVPCGWFPALAAFCRAHPVLDVGVHLTLTCEWDAYRWGPVSTRDPASGMMDAEGYFYRTSEDAQQHGAPDAVRGEIEAQVERALAAGVDATHIDTHMGTVVHPKYLAAYVQAATARRLPAMLVRWRAEQLRAYGLDEATIETALGLIEMLETAGMPLLDHLETLPLDDVSKDRVEQAKGRLGALPPGITHFYVHPAQDTPELRALADRNWEARVADYEALRSEALRDFIEREGIHVIGYRALRDLLRGGDDA